MYNKGIKLYYFFIKGPRKDAIQILSVNCLLIFALLALSYFFPKIETSLVLVSLVIISINGLLLGLILNRLGGVVNDVQNSISLNSGLHQAGFNLPDFFTEGAAASASLQLFILKALLFVKPKKTLELGSGQSTKLLSAYSESNHDAEVVTLEQDNDWAQRLAPIISHTYLYSKLTERSISVANIKHKITTSWYEYIPETQYDFIIVDGPDSNHLSNLKSKYSRVGIIEYIPKILSEKFIIVFDDAERYGELMTTKLLTDVLENKNIPFISFSIHGVKSQVVFCSPAYSFLRSV
ncbi:MAG: putative O-methyltransferase YrrM [Psychromonas sp.]|jgi:predicted O-methyltransferase YrrM